MTPSLWAVGSATVDLSDFFIVGSGVSHCWPSGCFYFWLLGRSPPHMSSVSSWLCLWETPPLRYSPRPATPTANRGTCSWELSSFLRVWVWRPQGVSDVNKLRFLSGSPVPWKYNCFTLSAVCSWPFPEHVLRASSFQVTDLTDWFLSPPPISLTKCQENHRVNLLGPTRCLRSWPVGPLHRCWPADSPPWCEAATTPVIVLLPVRWTSRFTPSLQLPA